MSDVIDKVFEGEDWESRSLPTQNYPTEVSNLLRALDVARVRGWLSAESDIRDLGGEARSDLATWLSDLRRSLKQHPSRYFVLAGDGKPLHYADHRGNENSACPVLERDER